jgi:ubiquinone/menaquinone biosynthesis C-methylase UbiE
VPLSKGLALELSNLELTTGSKADQVVKEIVCCDYSATVIYICKENQRREISDMLSNGKPLMVDYVTADARQLQYPDGRFHLVMEKGTLDAVLSDKETGVDSSIQIMTECARVLKEGGK